ncbi:VOC family protein [Arthrobacter sp. OY3WO11]|jgi:catechol 2,3-dioxygenase-like lactoylglutathione lyase family enzyme|uniref:VOC family protein n=1 Tax=Arthrobacter sp. OY3WO11 TaxID=1835723 RepID=UPI0007D03703|nr:VOC family protein [Arthrobacter sp. OY3WO11]OAE01958.1 glyoxalase [Arthrobacter sp. OY3WO11]
MQPRVDFISLGVRSVAASRAFYVDGLGWPVHRELPGDVVFIQVNHGLVLSLWDVRQMQADAGVTATGGVPCITLSHNLPGTEDVDRVMEEAAAAGAEIIAEPITQPWGGYSGYFADPDGFRWEVAYNPTWAVDDDGAVTV